MRKPGRHFILAKIDLGRNRVGYQCGCFGDPDSSDPFPSYQGRSKTGGLLFDFKIEQLGILQLDIYPWKISLAESKFEDVEIQTANTEKELRGEEEATFTLMKDGNKVAQVGVSFGTCHRCAEYNDAVYR